MTRTAASAAESLATPPLDPAASPLGPEQGHALLAVDPQQHPYRVQFPGVCFGHASYFVATVQLCVSTTGAVSSVQVLEPSIPLIDEQLPVVLGRWRFHPFLRGGKPTPFCYRLRYRVT